IGTITVFFHTYCVRPVMKETAKFTVFTQGIIALFVVGVVLYQLQSVLLPFFVAIFLSYIFKPIVLYLESKKVPMILSLFLVLLNVAVVLFVMSQLVYLSITSINREQKKNEARLNTLKKEAVVIEEHKAEKIKVNISDYAWRDLIQVASITELVTACEG